MSTEFTRLRDVNLDSIRRRKGTWIQMLSALLRKNLLVLFSSVSRLSLLLLLPTCAMLFFYFMNSPDISLPIGPFFNTAYMLQATLMMNLVAREKQLGLIGALRTIGLRDSTYWISWLLSHAYISFLSTVIMVGLAYALNVQIISLSSFLPPILLLWIGAMAMFCFTLLVVAVAAKQSLITSLGFLGTIFALIVSALTIAKSIEGPSSSTGRVFRWCFPWYSIEKVLGTMDRYNDVPRLNQTYSLSTMFMQFGVCNESLAFINEKKCVNAMAFDFALCTEDQVNDPACYYYPPSDASNLFIMSGQILVYLILVWYVFQVVPSGNNGRRRSPTFLFDKRYWVNIMTLRDTDSVQYSSYKDKSIRISELSKSYRGVEAVSSVSLTIDSGQVYVIVGSNSSGKSTLINMLTGRVAASDGEAYVLGQSIHTNYEEIQSMVGVVPQSDLLWDELSAYEHLRLYAVMKGIGSNKKREIQAILRKVSLAKVAARSVSTYSGGIKRRLSIALAVIGNPSLLVLDEPTRGIDPLNQRRIWKLIEDLKQERSVLITTHSMQEADVLGDYVAIMDHGSMLAFGTPMDLKAAYGKGFTIRILANVCNIDIVCAIARETLGFVDIVSRAAGSITIGIPPSMGGMIPKLISYLEAAETDLADRTTPESRQLIREWSVFQSSLEEVYLRLVKRNPNQAPTVKVIGAMSQSRVIELSSAPNGEGGVSYNRTPQVFDSDGILQGGATSHSGWRQMSMLLHKLDILQRRSFGSTLMHLTFPLVAMLVLRYVVLGNEDSTDIPHDRAPSLASAIVLVLLFRVPSIVSLIVYEKQEKYLFMLLLNGLRLRYYWISMYAFQMTWFLIISAIGLGTVFLTVPELTKSPIVANTLVLTGVFNHSMLGVAVLTSAFFTQHRPAAIFMYLFIIATVVVSFVLLFYEKAGGEYRWHWLALVSPIGLARGLFLTFRNDVRDDEATISTLTLIVLISGTCYLAAGIMLSASTGIGATWRVACVSGKPCDQGDDDPIPGALDDDDDTVAHEADVYAEQQRALQLKPEDSAINIQHLDKTFPGRPPINAVVDLCLAMDYGECLGLLAPKSSGKSSLINMLSGQLDPSSGTAYVGGHDVVRERHRVMGQIGLVPQFDILYGNLTVQEHLELYAAMKGISSTVLTVWLQYITHRVSLDRDSFKRRVKDLNGGLQRQLSFAIALLNNPRIIFLDEPTTGLDPDMRRIVWGIIEQLKLDKCVVLATQTMDEAETLCNRVGILAGGSLKYVGTQTSLRQRYSATFELSFTLTRDGPAPSIANSGSDVSGSIAHDHVAQHFCRECPSIRLVSTYGPTRVYTVGLNDIDLEALFSLILRGQEQGLFAEWSISHTSLDEMFCSIAAESEGSTPSLIVD